MASGMVFMINTFPNSLAKTAFGIYWKRPLKWRIKDQNESLFYLGKIQGQVISLPFWEKTVKVSMEAKI